MSEVQAIHALDRITDGIISLNRDLQVTYMNQTAKTLLDDKEILGKALTKKINLSIHQQSELHFEHKCEDQKWLHVHMYPSADGITILVRDITAKKQIEKKEEAEKANLAKSKFLSMMSHELRTPLNSIIGFAQILEEDSRDQGQQDKVQKILKSSRHLLQLINDIIEIIRLDTVKRQVKQDWIVINKLMEDSIKIVRPLAEGKGIHIQYVSDPKTDWNMKGDPERLTKIMLHLLTNAVKFTHPSGFITVTALQEEHQLKVVVSDTGVGIPAEEHKKIFNPFYKIFHKNLNIEGAGIGLPMVKRLVEEMNGDVGVRSTPGEGSRFWFTLPADFS
jgi:signal transduction histidine kinase